MQLSASAARQPVIHIDATAAEIRETAVRWPMNVCSRIKSVCIRAEAYEIEQAGNAPIWNGLPVLLQLQISSPAHIGPSLHFWQPVHFHQLTTLVVVVSTTFSLRQLAKEEGTCMPLPKDVCSTVFAVGKVFCKWLCCYHDRADWMSCV